MSSLTEIAFGLEKSWTHSRRDAQTMPWHICAAALIAGIISGQNVCGPLSTIFLIICILASTAANFLHHYTSSVRRNRASWLISWILLWWSAGCLMISQPPAHPMPFGTECTVMARIESLPPASKQADVRVAEYWCGSVQISADFRIKLGLSPQEAAASSPLYRGAWIMADGQFYPFEAPDVPGMFNAKEWGQNEGLSGRFVRLKQDGNYTPIRLIDAENARPSLRARLERARRIAFEKLAQASEYGIMPALVLGTGKDISQETRTAFGYLGIAHVLAVSGLHFGIIAIILTFAAGKAAAFSPWLMRRLGRKRAAALAALPGLAVYLFFVGAPISAQRSLAMLAVCTIGRAIARKPDRIRALAFAAILILAISPRAVLTISFQLSFSAVLGIIWGMEFYDSRIKPRFEAIQRPWLKSASSALAASLIITISTSLTTGPFVIAHFGQLPLTGILTNLLVIPYVSFIMMPLSMAAAFFTALSLPGSETVVWAGGAAEHLLVSFADICAKNLPAAWIELTPHPAIIAVSAAAAWAILFPFRKLCIRLTCACTGLLALASLLIISAVNPRIWSQTDGLRISFAAMGQADAALVEFPGGKTMLIDAGCELGRSENAVKTRLLPYLRQLGIRHIDTLVATHGDYDHTAGIESLIENINVGSVWINGIPHDPPSSWERAVSQKNIPILNVQNIHTKALSDGSNIQILWPTPDGIQSLKDTQNLNENESSIVLKIIYGDFSILFMGDAGIPVETQLLAYSAQPVTVLKVGHHGSKSASSDAWIRALQPQISIFSVGPHNRYKFPHADVQKRLVSSQMFRTDEHGTIRLTTDGHHILTETMRR